MKDKRLLHSSLFRTSTCQLVRSHHAAQSEFILEIKSACAALGRCRCPFVPWWVKMDRARLFGSRMHHLVAPQLETWTISSIVVYKTRSANIPQPALNYFAICHVHNTSIHQRAMGLPATYCSICGGPFDNSYSSIVEDSSDTQFMANLVESDFQVHNASSVLVL